MGGARQVVRVAAESAGLRRSRAAPAPPATPRSRAAARSAAQRAAQRERHLPLLHAVQRLAASTPRSRKCSAAPAARSRWPRLGGGQARQQDQQQQRRQPQPVAGAGAAAPPAPAPPPSSRTRTKARRRRCTAPGASACSYRCRRCPAPARRSPSEPCVTSIATHSAATAGMAHQRRIRMPASSANTPMCSAFDHGRTAANSAQPAASPMPPWTASTNWIQ